MFEIEVVRFDAQDVIATSAVCNGEGTVHLHIQNGTASFYLYENGVFVPTTVAIDVVNMDEVANASEEGWYALPVNNGVITFGVKNNALSDDYKCPGDMLHPIQ